MTKEVYARTEKNGKSKLVACDYCGKEFSVIPYYIKRNKYHFCSKLCNQRGRSKFFVGENNPFYGKNHTEETKRKNSLAHIGKQTWLGKHHTKETKKKISEIRKQNKIPAWNKGLRKETDERVKKYSGTWLGRHHTLESKLKMSASQKGKSRGKGIKKSEETKKKLSIISKEQWKDSNYAKKIIESQHRKPTKPEKFLTEFLNLNFPNEWKYVGNGKFWIEGKNPDFINCNGKKLIVEFDGIYWHKNQLRDLNRNKIYEKYGYKVLSLNEFDLKNIENLLNKLNDFIVRTDKI